MEQIPALALVKILGEFAESPITALRWSETSGSVCSQMSDAWSGLFHHWSKRFGDANPRLFPEDKRKSERLRRRDYYSTRLQYLRLLRLGRENCHQVCVDTSTFGRQGFLAKLRRLLASLAPVWSGRVLLEGVLLAKELEWNQSLAVVQELVGNWSAIPSTQALCIACARGFYPVVEFLLQQRPEQLSLSVAYKLTVALVVPGGRVRLSGEFTPKAWATYAWTKVQDLPQAERWAKCLQHFA